MRRVFWTGLGIGLGAASGVIVARRLRRTADAFTPSSIAGGVAGSISGLTGAIKDFAADVREGMDERERELYDALGVGDEAPTDT